VYKRIKFNPGLYKIFDEIVVNARDEFVRSTMTAGMTPVKKIDISVMNKDGDCIISVENDGDGIPIEENAEGVMIPEMIFGQLLTSSNYNKSEEKVVGGKNGYGGKCLAPDTKVIHWSSRETRADEVKVGDKLVGDDGTVRTVLATMNGTGQLYEVQQANSESYIVNDEHVLTLHMPDHKVIFWNTGKIGWSILWWDHENNKINAKLFPCETRPSVVCPECKITLSQNLGRHYRRVHKGMEIPKNPRKLPTILPEESEEANAALMEAEEFAKTIPDENVFDISIKKYMLLNKTTQMRLAGVRGQCIQWPTKEVVLDPYVLGLWLGDGMQRGYDYACFGEKDPEIINYLTEWAKNNDANFRQKGKYVYAFTTTREHNKKGHAPLAKQLRTYNLVNNKHIPHDYLFNDRATRLAVLAGIIDTDGSVTRNGTRISISQGMNHTQLAHDIIFLARSLGFNCQTGVRDTTWTWKGEKRHGHAIYMNISGEGAEDIPTLLPRKKCASPVAHNTSKSTGYITIRDAGVGEYIGIKIDGNERFLINDFTVTHNCTNILSKLFTVNIKTPASGKEYSQSWYNNMFQVEKPSIKKTTSKTGFVKITFIPDQTRFAGAFNEAGAIDDMLAVFHTRAVELAALVGAKVTWNGAVIPSNTFEKYIKLFLRDGMTGFAYEQCGPRWEVGAILASHLYSDEEELTEEKHISFVNGINTKKGGKHVETVTRKVLTDFCDLAKTKKVEIKPGQLKNAVVLFLNSTIVNPSFDSQSKEFLTTPAAEFGSRPEYSGKLITSLMKLGLLEEAKHVLEAKSLRDVKKTDGKKRTVLRGITKLEDALLAGTAKSSECTLILTEGDSAATSAISGLKEVGRERWGVFPLKGKLLNVRDITIQKFNANEELTTIKKILGLEQGKKYKDASELRYGRVMVMADQDHDGSHIKGLLMNLFHAEWPGLLQSGFLCTLLTPILKATKGKTVMSFYSIPEFQAWKDTLGPSGLAGCKIKYYKGLGTSTPLEAREWFRELKEIAYEWDEKTDETINLAFNKKQADDRKRWLAHYDPSTMLVPQAGKASYTTFINKELIHFSNADNIRSLPHIMDGLKPSQRKILYASFKRGLKEEIRVAQFTGYVSEHAAYHHGEASLNGTIVGMAQNFVGSNNINLFKPIGQFGSRLLGGKDAASPRYIHTCLEDIVAKLFRKEDACLLKHVDDDGDLVEPEYYLPVLPLLAINGSVGIGTGYSTDIPPHKPDDIACLLRKRLDGSIESLAGHPLDPWWFGFKGPVGRVDEQTWYTKGIYDLDDVKRTVTITELPVGTWTKNYKEFLDTLCEEDEKKSKEAKKEAKKAETASASSTKSAKEVEPCGLKGFDDLYNDVDVRFILYFTEEGYDTIKDAPEKFEKQFKLISTWKTTNMTCFDTDFNIVRYKTVGDIIETFMEKRLPMYEARRMSQLETLTKQITELDAKRRFIQAILDERLVLQKKTDEEIVAQLQACNIPPLSVSANGLINPMAYESYEYVLKMRIDRLKLAAVIELDKQITEKQGEIDYLESQTGASLWIQDLDEFQQSWSTYTASREAESVPAGARADAPKKKIAPLKKIAKK
jgi:DNA topoisomerase-2